MTAAIIAALIVRSAPALAQEAGPFDPETQARIETLQPFIAEAARRFPVPETWIRAVIAAESGGRTELDEKPITSAAGAMGPMQVMPETYEDMRSRYALGPDPYDPENNILAGTAYLGELNRRFGFTGMFAAYNAGPDRYQQFLDSGRPLPAETAAYLAALNLSMPTTNYSPGSGSGKNLFFPISPAAVSAPLAHPEAAGGSLFMPLDQTEPDPGGDKKRR